MINRVIIIVIIICRFGIYCVSLYIVTILICPKSYVCQPPQMPGTDRGVSKLPADLCNWFPVEGFRGLYSKSLPIPDL